MRLQSIGARLSSTVGVAVVSSVITTMVLTGGYAVATTVLPDNSVSSINIVDGTIRRADLSPRLRARIDAPGPQGPTGPQGPAGSAGPRGPAGATGLNFHLVPLILGGAEFCAPRDNSWEFPYCGYNRNPELDAVSIDSSDYPPLATVSADYAFYSSNLEAVCVRLFDLTDQAPIASSEVCVESQPYAIRVVSPAAVLPEGEHLITMQARNTFLYDSGIVQARSVRLRIEWPD